MINSLRHAVLNGLPPNRPFWLAALSAIAFFTALGVYAAMGAFALVVAPPLGAIFIAPIIVGVLAMWSQGLALPRAPLRLGVYVGAFLLVLWPVYMHVKIGPLPILTPPRLVFYTLTGAWVLDMLRSPLRRGQFVYAVRRGGWISFCVFGMFVLGALSLPLAEGRAISVPEFVRQTIIWMLPFCVTITYIRRPSELMTLVKILVVAAIVSGAIAVAETLSGTLMASVLSPLISDSVEWLRNVQAQKIRDGVFRAQASHTHPLSLGEFQSIMAPFAVAFMLAAKRAPAKAWWAIGLALILAGAVATSSRAAFLAIIVSMSAMGAVLGVRLFQRAAYSPFRPLVGLAVLAMIVASPIVLIGAQKFISGEGGQSASNSSQARIDQITQAWPKILKRPVGGYGVGRSTKVLGFWGQGLTIDNYYLSLALDLGLPGPLMFIGIFAAMGFSAMQRSRDGPTLHQLMYLAFAASAAGIVVCRMVLSLTGNLSVYYVLVGAFAGASVAYGRRMRKNARFH